jgi:hypothetical protein
MRAKAPAPDSDPASKGSVGAIFCVARSAGYGNLQIAYLPRRTDAAGTPIRAGSIHAWARPVFGGSSIRFTS